MKEINVDGLKPYYKIDEYGNVYSMRTGDAIKLKCDTDKDLYYQISLQTVDGKRKSFRVNRLVALTFIPNPNNYPVVNHIDGNKQNNCVTNLEWTTISYNTAEGYKLRDYHYKKRIKSTNLLTKESREFDSIDNCANFYNVPYFDISKIANKKISPRKRGKIANLDFEFID